MNNEFDEHDPTLPDAGDEAGVPLGTGDFGAQSGFTSGEAPSAVKRHAGGALLITGVVAVAIAGLFSMRTLTRASAAIEAPTDVERSIERFLGMIESSKSGAAAQSVGEQGVLDVLSESYTQRQVPLKAVQRNPFIIFESTETKPGPIAKAPDVDPRIEMRRVRTEQFERASERLRLGSVLMGSNPLANINNQVLRVGDSITIQPNEITFTVTFIEPSSVTLVAMDPELEVRFDVVVSIRRDR